MSKNIRVSNFLTASAIALVYGCASPTVVQERQAGDQALSCDQLIQGIDEARDFERKARGERGATGTNVAAAVLFWPGLLATYANTGDAISAAQERQRHLTKIYDGKSCDQSKLAAATAAAAAAAAAPVVAVSAPMPATPSATNVAIFKVNSMSGARVFTGPMAEGEPIHVFANSTVLTVVESTTDGRWHKVIIPDGRAGFVPTAVVQVSNTNAGSANAK